MSEQAPRIFTTEFKERAVLRLEAGASASALATELGVRRKLLYDWRQAEFRGQYIQLDAALASRGTSSPPPTQPPSP